MSITDLVTDWGGFEKLVAKLHETGKVTVEHNVILQGRSGAPRQIDVLIRHKEGLYEHMAVAECKYWNSQVERLHVDALATTVREVGASRGVIFSTQGFQSGAITQAEHDAIDLFVVRDLTAEEWGLPGRVVDLFLQVIQPGIGNIVIQSATKFGNPANNAPIAIKIEFGPDGPVSSTPTLKRDTISRGDSLEQYIFDAAHKALVQALGDGFTLNGGAECSRYMKCPVNLQLDRPFLIPINTFEIAIIPKMSFDLGIKISQSRITVDRAEQYLFALAVENCVNGSVSAAARPRGAEYTTLSDIAPAKADLGGDGPVANGSVIRVVMKGFFPLEEMNGLQPIDDPRMKR
jgi:hypothetical protein